MADHTYKLGEVPKGERRQYFLDYYKRPLIYTVVAIIALISLVKGVFFKPKNDVAIIALVSSQYVSDQIWAAIEPALAESLPDYNEDGKNLVYINSIFINESIRENDPETFSAYQTKVMADLSSAEYALQITDDGLFSFLEAEQLLATYGELGEVSGHESDEVIKIPLKELSPFQEFHDLPDGLYMTLRPRDAMQLGNSKAKKEQYEQQIDALKLMMNGTRAIPISENNGAVAK